MTFLWHLLPWWTWASILVFVVVISALGLWPIVRGLVSVVVNRIPWRNPWTWAAIGAIAVGWAGYVWLGVHDAALTKSAGAARDALWQARQKKADDLAQTKLDGLAAQLLAQQLDHAQELAAADAKRVSDLAELRKRMPAYVATLAIPAGDAPRGYVLWRGATAAFANGADFAAAPGPAEGPLNGPSGVSFATLAETDAAQADAFRAATEWGRGWQTYARDLKNACQSQLDILTKGTP